MSTVQDLSLSGSSLRSEGGRPNPVGSRIRLTMGSRMK
jgi:hypothetical protein